MTPSSPGEALESRRPKSSQTVSVSFEEDNQQHGDNPHYRFDISECFETKTVTTTTRLTRKFPRLFVRDPAPLRILDSKEYPLATKPTPPELLAFSYGLGDGEHDDVQVLCDKGPAEDSGTPEQTGNSVDAPPKSPTRSRETSHSCPHRGSLSQSRATRPESRSPTDEYSRRVRNSKVTVLESPNGSFHSTSSKPANCFPSLPHSSVLSERLHRSMARSSSADAGGITVSTASVARRGMHDRSARPMASGFLATPDASEVVSAAAERPSRRRSILFEQLRNFPLPGHARETGSSDVASPAGSESPTAYSNVATPPITDNDPQTHLDTDEYLQHPSRSFQSRPTIDIAAAQDASLPSPRLSPNLGAIQSDAAENEEESDPIFRTSELDDQRGGWTDESNTEVLSVQQNNAGPQSVSRRYASDQSAIINPQAVLEVFDSMKTEMKTFMMYQFLRRCPRSTLRVVADAVNPALKCDFIRQLPLELGYHVLSYLDHRDLCRAAQVSKHWRNIIDRNETGWKELFDKSGFTLAPGELHKAITQGWGWQDPAGPMSYEKDLSLQHRLTTSEQELTRSVKSDGTTTRPRASKRKRGFNSYAASERSKRRASANETAALRDCGGRTGIKQHKSEGPLSAANAAALAVPDPHLGQASLRELHLFKSLYRRHHMIRQSWTNGQVPPRHVAFAAHPRHVITCLQFDDDKLITGSDDQLIHIYDTKTGKLRKKLEGHEGGVWALQYEGNMLVSGSTDRSVRVWDIERGLCQQVFYGHTSTVRCLQILMPAETARDIDGNITMQPEKPLIITGSRDSHLRVWRLPEVGSRRYIQTGPPAHESDCPYFIRTLAGHAHSVRAISAHGDTLVSGSYDSTVRVWTISTGECRFQLQGHSQKVYSVVYDHERNRCISGSMDSLVKIWDLTDGSCIHTLEGHSLLVGLLDLRDERLVSAAADSTLRIWDPETGKCRNTLMAHTGAITCFQHDGRKVISGSEKTVKMWDMRTGECIQDMLTDLSGVWQVKFDERRCVTAVQRDQLTYVEILDFGAVRDGVPPDQLGRRILLNEPEVRAMIEEEI